MSDSHAETRFAAYTNREGVFCPVLSPDRGPAVLLDEVQPGTVVEMALRDFRGTGAFDKQLAILLALDALDGEGKWSAFVETAFEIGAELYRRTLEQNGAKAP